MHDLSTHQRFILEADPASDLAVARQYERYWGMENNSADFDVYQHIRTATMRCLAGRANGSSALFPPIELDEKAVVVLGPGPDFASNREMNFEVVHSTTIEQARAFGLVDFVPEWLGSSALSLQREARYAGGKIVASVRDLTLGDTQRWHALVTSLIGNVLCEGKNLSTEDAANITEGKAIASPQQVLEVHRRLRDINAEEVRKIHLLLPGRPDGWDTQVYKTQRGQDESPYVFDQITSKGKIPVGLFSAQRLLAGWYAATDALLRGFNIHAMLKEQENRQGPRGATGAAQHLAIDKMTEIMRKGCAISEDLTTHTSTHLISDLLRLHPDATFIGLTEKDVAFKPTGRCPDLGIYPKLNVERMAEALSSLDINMRVSDPYTERHPAEMPPNEHNDVFITAKRKQTP